MKSRSRLMLEKSVAAMLSAIEIYNKPDFKYREETFAVLCINSWELLLKAKVLNLAGNKPAALYVMEYKTLKNGQRSKIKHRKSNRAGNPLSVGLLECYRIITEDYGVKLEKGKALGSGLAIQHAEKRILGTGGDQTIRTEKLQLSAHADITAKSNALRQPATLCLAASSPS